MRQSGGAELAEVHYTDGGFESVTIKYGTKESLDIV